MRDSQRATLILFSVAFIWGMTFIWMKQALAAADSHLIGVDGRWVAMHFVAFRFLIGSFFTIVLLRSSRSGFNDPEVWRGGFSLGLILILGFLVQMVGLTNVTPAVSAFLTSLYVVFTAIIGVAIGRQRFTPFMLLGVVLATFGAGWISGPPRVEFGVGGVAHRVERFPLRPTHNRHRRRDQSRGPNSIDGYDDDDCHGVGIRHSNDPTRWDTSGSGWLGILLLLLIRFGDYVIPLSLCGFFGSFVALAATDEVPEGDKPRSCCARLCV